MILLIQGIALLDSLDDSSNNKIWTRLSQIPLAELKNWVFEMDQDALSKRWHTNLLTDMILPRLSKYGEKNWCSKWTCMKQLLIPAGWESGK